MYCYKLRISGTSSVANVLLIWIRRVIHRLLYGRGVPLGHIGTGVAISA